MSTVYKTRKTTNHLRHFIFGFFTGGLWWFTGWPYCAMRNRRAQAVTTVQQKPMYQQSGYHSAYMPMNQQVGYRGNEWRQS
jgi:hypothetical protein